MSKRVMVTGVGGGSGMYTSRILKETGYEVVGIDSQGYAVGSIIVDNFCIVSPASNRIQFVRDVRRIQERFDVDIILPNVDDELMIFAEEFGRDAIISPSSTVDICLDKYATFKEYVGKVKVPATCLYQHEEDWFGFRGKVVAKPRRGRGSKGVYIFDTPSDASECRSLFRGKDYVIQEFIDGHEYTVDVLSTAFNGNYIYPRRRLIVSGGLSHVGWTQGDIKVIEATEKVLEALEFVGPINIQFIKNDRGVYLIEINPRLSGGIGITYANGANLPDMAIKERFGDYYDTPKVKQDIVFRYLVEGKHESTN